MKSIFTLLIITLFTFVLNGCGIGAIASMVVNKGDDVIPIYTTSKENQVLLKEMVTKGYRVKIGTFTNTNESNQSIKCRLMTSVKPPKGKTYKEYIQHAFKTEFKSAKFYNANTKIIINATIQELTGTSMYGNAYWLFKVTLTSSNGNSYKVNSKYIYDSSFRASNACKDMHRTFPLAVQKLIRDTITNPKFKTLLYKADR